MKGERSFTEKTRQRCLKLLATESSEERAVTSLIEQRLGSPRLLESDVIDLLGSWHYWAILELFKLPAFTQTPQEIMQRLGLDAPTVDLALERLVQFGFLSGAPGRYVLQSPNNNWTNTKETSTARKKLQKTFLEKSVVALEELPFDVREHASLTLAVDRERLPEFKERLKALRQEFGNFAQKTGQFSDVYQLTISLFPLTKDTHA